MATKRCDWPVELGTVGSDDELCLGWLKMADDVVTSVVMSELLLVMPVAMYRLIWSSVS